MSNRQARKTIESVTMAMLKTFNTSDSLSRFLGSQSVATLSNLVLGGISSNVVAISLGSRPRTRLFSYLLLNVSKLSLDGSSIGDPNPFAAQLLDTMNCFCQTRHLNWNSLGYLVDLMGKAGHSRPWPHYKKNDSLTSE